MRESEGGHCVPPILTPAKGYLEEKVTPGFGLTRKRPLGLKAEQEDTEREEGERVSHPEKRARISMGENFLNMPHHPHATSIFLKSTPLLPPPSLHLLSVHLFNSALLFFPSSCVMPSPVSSLVLF